MIKKYQKIIIFILLFTCFNNYSFWGGTEAEVSIPPAGDGSILSLITTNTGRGNTNTTLTVVQGGKTPDLSKFFDGISISTHMKNSYECIKTQSYDFIKNNYGKIIISTALTTYLWILYQIHQTSLLIKERTAWCNWKAIMPLSHLQSTPCEELTAQLKITIYRKYGRSTNECNTSNYVALFLNDIKSELEIFNTYLDWYNFTQNTFSGKFFNFPFDIVTIEEKKARIYFILDIFMIQQSEKI